MKDEGVQSIPLAELIEDYDLYPRQSVDSVNVTRAVDALNAGGELPRIVAEHGTGRVVDGFHRRRAYLRLDPTMSVEVQFYSYTDDAELFLHAVKLNAAHGKALGKIDQVRTLIRAEELGIDPDHVAGALSIPIEKMDDLRVTRTAIGADSRPVPIKRGQGHLAGRKLTKRQQQAMKRSQGMSVWFFADQIANALEGNLIDWSNARESQALWRLAVEVFPKYADRFTPPAEEPAA